LQRYSVHPLTFTFAKAKLAKVSQWEENARKRWAEWYLSFAIEKSSDHNWWEEQRLSHKYLNKEWGNLLAVFDWCQDKEIYYHAMKKFWLRENTSEFAKIYGYWEDRVEWLRWLMQKAEEYGEMQDMVAAASGIIWTFTRMGRNDQLEEANRLSKIAWKYRDYANPKILSLLTDNIAVNCIRQQRWEDAMSWFNISLEFLHKSGADYREEARKKCHILYYKAEFYQKTGDFAQAEDLYQKGLRLAEYGCWERAVFFFKNRLADIAIERDDLDVAGTLLSDGLSMARRKSDKRAIALYQRSFAKIESKKKNWEVSRQHAEMALDIFVRLGMQNESYEMQNFLKALE